MGCGAHSNDHQLLFQTLESVPVPRPEPTPQQSQELCLDGGYGCDEVRQRVQEFGLALHVQPRDWRRYEMKGELGKKARRLLLRLAKDELTTVDAVNVLRAGRIIEPPEQVQGTWRYRVHTERMVVFVAFVSESKLKIVTAWRKKK